MSTEAILFYLLLTVVISLSFIFSYIELTKKELDTKLAIDASNKIQKTSDLNPNLSLIESHKILTNTIKTIFKNKRMNSTRMLKKVSKKFKEEEKFWLYHRMRNKAAHQEDFKVTRDDAAKAREIFREALNALIN